MTAIVILNIVFAMFVVLGILSLLGWAIVTDNAKLAFRGAGAHRGVRGQVRRNARVAQALDVPGARA